MEETKPDAAHSHPWKVGDVVIFPVIALGFGLEYFWASSLPALPRPVGIMAGVTLSACGVWLIVWAKRSLKAHDQPILPGEPTTRLVTKGAFGRSRNPTYAGSVLAVFGGGVAFDSLWVMAAAVVIGAILDYWMIRPEERYLTARFGPEFEDYRRRVRRWF